MKNSNFVISLIVALISAISCGITLWFQYRLYALICYAAIILCLPAASLLHELGHVLFGAMSKIKAVPKFSLLGSSSCKIIPKTDKKLRGRLIFTTLGGLTVNALCIAVGCLAVFLPSVFPAWLGVFLPASVYLFMYNVMPAELPAGKTDGLVLSELIKDEDAAKVTVAVLTVQARLLKGTPIAEIDKNLLFELPVIREDDPAYISLTQLRYEYFTALGEEVEAQKYRARLQSLQQYL